MTKMYKIMIGDLHLEKFWKMTNSFSLDLSSDSKDALLIPLDKVNEIVNILEGNSMNPTIIEVVVTETPVQRELI